MSDPVSNSEVEDVLSSIRRLVSEEKRPLAQGGASVAKSAPDKLVLTPALRVAEDPEPVADAPQDPAATPQSSQDAPEDVDERILSAVQEAAVPEIEELLDPEDEVSFEHVDDEEDVVVVPPANAGAVETSEDPAEDYSADPYGFDSNDDEPEPEVWSTRRKATLRPDPSEAAATTEAGATEPSSDDEFAARETSLTAKIEALETAIGRIPDQWEPDREGEDAYAGTRAKTMDWEVEEAANPVDDTAETHSEIQATSDEAVEGIEDLQDIEVPPEDGPSAEVVALPDVTEAPEEDADLSDALQSEPNWPRAPEAESAESASRELETAFTEAEPVVDKAEPEAQGETPAMDVPLPVRPPMPDAVELGDMLDDGVDQIVDEEALRDMVSEIVRAELQGALGERITRNVRKLVRREIHRALAAQELE